MKSRGQALVEFALVLPVLMFLLLGFGETAFLVATQHGFQNGADVLAQWAAIAMSDSPGESWHAGWERIVAQESARTDCGDRHPTVTFPDETHEAGDRVLVALTCQYHPRITSFWSGLPVTVESEAVVPASIPEPTPSASPS